MGYEYNTKESAYRLLGYCGDFSDSLDDLKDEAVTVENAFKKIRESKDADIKILSIWLDRMLMRDDFKNGSEWLNNN